MTLGNLAFLPDPVAKSIQDGILERRIMKALRPALMWRALAQAERHAGRIGDRVIKTRAGLITPSSKSTARITAGQDPQPVTRSQEQFSYQVQPYGNTVDIHLPSSFMAIANRFLDDMDALAFHGSQTISRFCRDALVDAYEGGDTYTTDDPGATTSVAVAECKGFDKVVVNGEEVSVSVTNTVSVTIGGTARSVTAVTATDGSSPPSGPGTLTISSALDYAQYDRVIRTDAPTVIRENSRTTDRTIVAGDTATIETFRNAAAVLRKHSVPTLPGTSLYGVMVNPDIMNALFADSEFHDAIQSQGIVNEFAVGAIGDYAGMRFFQNPEMPSILSGGSLQTYVHRSIVFGAECLVEAYTPESDFEMEVPMEGIARGNHFKMPIDPAGALSMVVRAPMDRAGRTLSASWLMNGDWTVPTDLKSGTGNARFKRAVVVKTAGPATL